MKNNRMFLKCEACGEILGVINDSNVVPVCCGKEMSILKANTTDASKEKHVPEGVIEGNTLTVTVGSVPHPMTEEHHIAWIAVAQEKHTQRISLDHDKEPKAVFTIDTGKPVTVYEYCNLHGLWAAELN